MWCIILPIMQSPYGLKIIESCISCPLRHDRLFCDLSPAGVEKLSKITSSATYPKGAILFVEGQASRGVFIICSGRVKLSCSSAEGKTVIVRVAELGELVGVPGTLTGKPYGVTAEVLEPTLANFIPRELFLRFLQEHGEAAVRVAQLLSELYQNAYEEIRSLGLSRSSAGKLAKFLLDWSNHHGQNAAENRLTITLTHEEIAQTIGASRETVTRLFSEFKKKQLVQVKGSTLVIRNRPALETLVGA
jgi:CRP/FNR family cyclic AMP-dependent transcriptional regulator